MSLPSFHGLRHILKDLIINVYYYCTQQVTNRDDIKRHFNKKWRWPLNWFSKMDRVRQIQGNFMILHSSSRAFSRNFSLLPSLFKIYKSLKLRAGFKLNYKVVSYWALRNISIFQYFKDFFFQKMLQMFDAEHRLNTG